MGIIENNQYGSDRQCFLEGTKMKAYLRATWGGCIIHQENEALESITAGLFYTLTSSFN